MNVESKHTLAISIDSNPKKQTITTPNAWINNARMTDIDLSFSGMFKTNN